MPDTPTVQPLPHRQQQVLELVAKGLTSAAIGGVLHLTEATVKQYLRRLYRTLGAADRAHAVALGYQRGHLRLPASPCPPNPSALDCLRRLAAREAQ
jgi:DNA-binding NarL/FixJ family response regulator